MRERSTRRRLRLAGTSTTTVRQQEAGKGNTDHEKSLHQAGRYKGKAPETGRCPHFLRLGCHLRPVPMTGSVGSDKPALRVGFLEGSCPGGRAVPRRGRRRRGRPGLVRNPPGWRPLQGGFPGARILSPRSSPGPPPVDAPRDVASDPVPTRLGAGSTRFTDSLSETVNEPEPRGRVCQPHTPL
jgi:hypothetical protein